MDSICVDCDLCKLSDDLGLVVCPAHYEPKQVESLEVIRNSDKSGLGCLYFRGVYVCDTLEHSNYFMPVGTYRLLLTYSPKFKAYLPDIIIPGHSGVRIHAANYYYELRGCVAVGIAQEFHLINSKKTLDRVLRIIKECNVQYLTFSYA